MVKMFRKSVSFLGSETRDFLRSITIEPISFLFAFGNAIATGAQQVNNLQILKICQYELDYNSTICDNLGQDEWEDQQNEVQVRLNNFHLIGSHIHSPPPIIYALFIGAISDRFGRRPLMLVPLVGSILDSVSNMVNYVFLEEWPLEAFYMSNFFSYLGGRSMYYLGIYGFGADASKPEERAHRLARLDGFEALGYFFGTFISPLMLSWLGYYGCFGTQILFHMICFAIILFFIKEPRIKRTKGRSKKEDGTCKRAGKVVKKHVFQSCAEMVHSICRKRERNLRALVLATLCVFALFWFDLQALSLLYVFLRKTMTGFGGSDFAVYDIFMQTIHFIVLMIVLPIVGGKLKVHDALMLAVFTFIAGVGQVIAALSSGMLWVYYIGMGLKAMDVGVYTTTRSMLTKYTHPDEQGKVFSALALLAAFVPLISSPAFTTLYNSTLDTFPGAFLLLSASAYFLAVVIILFIWSQRDNMLVDRFGNHINGGYRDDPKDGKTEMDQS